MLTNSHKKLPGLQKTTFLEEAVLGGLVFKIPGAPGYQKIGARNHGFRASYVPTHL